MQKQFDQKLIEIQEQTQQQEEENQRQIMLQKQ